METSKVPGNVNGSLCGRIESNGLGVDPSVDGVAPRSFCNAAPITGSSGLIQPQMPVPLPKPTKSSPNSHFLKLERRWAIVQSSEGGSGGTAPRRRTCRTGGDTKEPRSPQGGVPTMAG